MTTHSSTSLDKPNQYMKRLLNKLVLLLGIASLMHSAQAFAEMRVVVQFDDSGHHLMRAVDLSPSLTLSEENVEKFTGDSMGNPTTLIVIDWFDEAGQLIHSGSIVDPRLTHAPLVDSAAAPQLVMLDSGAYMVTGPSRSTELEIKVPANPMLGLYAQTFRINLLN